MKSGAWVEKCELPSEDRGWCEACRDPRLALRWVVRCTGGGWEAIGALHLCTRHLHQLARSAMRASVRERLAKKRGKR